MALENMYFLLGAIYRAPQFLFDPYTFIFFRGNMLALTSHHLTTIHRLLFSVIHGYAYSPCSDEL